MAVIEATDRIATRAEGLRRRLAREAARMSGEQLVRAARRSVIRYGTAAGQALGLIERPRSRRAVPRVLAGALVGAGMAFLLDPDLAREPRRKLVRVLG
jgi:hypothetical protein